MIENQQYLTRRFSAIKIRRNSAKIASHRLVCQLPQILSAITGDQICHDKHIKSRSVSLALEKNSTPHWVSPPRCINGYRLHTAGVTLRWTSIPSRGGEQYPQLLHATETAINSGHAGLLGLCVTLPLNLTLTPHCVSLPRCINGYR